MIEQSHPTPSSALVIGRRAPAAGDDRERITTLADPMYLSTLRSYVEAVGGKLKLTVKLPSRPAIHLHSLGDVTMDAGTGVRTVARRRKQAGAR